MYIGSLFLMVTVFFYTLFPQACAAVNSTEELKNKISNLPPEMRLEIMSYLLPQIRKTLATPLIKVQEESGVELAQLIFPRVRVRNRTIVLIEREERKLLQGHTEKILTLCYTPDGRYLISGSHDKTIRIWDMQTCKCVKVLVGHASSVVALNVSKDGKYILSYSRDGKIKIWDMGLHQCIKTMDSHNDVVVSLQMSEDGERLLVGYRDLTLQIWHLAKGICLYTYQCDNYLQAWSYYSEDGRYIAGYKKKWWNPDYVSKLLNSNKLTAEQVLLLYLVLSRESTVVQSIQDEEEGSNYRMDFLTMHIDLQKIIMDHSRACRSKGTHVTH